ncbi:hypothetical protein M9H77_03870 [Catharanthus roseus]|uniref:Uncharacterized protein n=1 Tax=Catharanthus roseus TaxID=4058 RepID=A0ACC0CCF7_CATRO|nr:hypothetical protein M9H77_03870 [Catharanthus roseus]
MLIFEYKLKIFGSSHMSSPVICRRLVSAGSVALQLRHCNRSGPPFSRSSRDCGTPPGHSSRGGWRGRSRPSSGRGTARQQHEAQCAQPSTHGPADSLPADSMAQRLNPSDRTSVYVLPSQDRATGPIADPSNLASFLDQNISTAPYPVAPNPITFIPAAPPSPSQSTEILGTRKSTRIKKVPTRLQDFDCNAI